MQIDIALSNIFLKESYNCKYFVLDKNYNNNSELRNRATNYFIFIEIKYIFLYFLSNNNLIY